MMKQKESFFGQSHFSIMFSLFKGQSPQYGVDIATGRVGHSLFLPDTCWGTMCSADSNRTALLLLFLYLVFQVSFTSYSMAGVVFNPILLGSIMFHPQVSWWTPSNAWFWLLHQNYKLWPIQSNSFTLGSLTICRNMQELFAMLGLCPRMVYRMVYAQNPMLNQHLIVEYNHFEGKTSFWDPNDLSWVDVRVFSQLSP